MVGFTYRRNNEFYFDKKFFDIVSKYYWVLDSSKNVITKIDGKNKMMHHILFGDKILKHKNGLNYDNREENVVDIRGLKNNHVVILNGYISIYMPEHKRAFDNGCVYEHILVAERMLGRELLPEECVHHKDKNRQNNDESNLMVFATLADHAAFHAGANAVLQSNGAYISEYDSGELFFQYINQTIDMENTESINANFKNKDVCPVCKKRLKYKKGKMCVECREKERAKNIPPKEELEKYIGIISFVQLGKKYGVSDNNVRKWCKKYNLPFRRKDIETEYK